MPGSIATFVVKRPRPVAAVWLVTVAVSVVLSSGLFGELSNRGGLVSGSDSDQAARIVEHEIPGRAGAQVLVVVKLPRPDEHEDWMGRATTLVRQAVASRTDVARVTYEGAGVAYRRDVDALASGVAAVSVYLRMDAASAEKQVPSLRRQLEHLSVPGAEGGLLGGPAISQRYSEIAHRDLVRAESLAFPLILVLLLVAFQGPLAAVLPLLLAAVTLVTTFAFLALFGHQVGLSVFVTNTASILALGLSVDFSLFIITRFREELGRAASREEAMIATLTTTGRAVVLSTVTIAASLVGLSVVGIQIFSSMAAGATFAIAFAGLSALTLLPALICLIGPRVERAAFARISQAAERATLWNRLAATVTRRPSIAACASLALLLAMALPVTSFRLSIHTVTALPPHEPVGRTTAEFTHHFSRGALQPIDVVTREQPERVAPLIQTTFGLTVYPVTSGRHGWSHLLVTPTSAPDSVEALRLVLKLRRLMDRRTTAATYVGGAMAGSVDLVDRVRDRTPYVVTITTALGFLILCLGLRSLVIPVKAVIGTLLSTAAALGILLRLFPAEHGTASIEFFVPLFLFAILFGLSVDYEVFLLSRIREAARAGHDTREAVRRGLVGSGRSITLAGLTLAIVFLAFAMSQLRPFQQLGLGLALAVVLDITLVRCVLVPASVVLLGRWNWWYPTRAGRRPARGYLSRRNDGMSISSSEISSEER